MKAGKGPVTFCKSGIIEIRDEDIRRLKKEAAKSDLKRARLCLHKDHADKVHEMVIAFCKGSYARPHRHSDKSESFHVIEGRMTVALFDRRGKVMRRVEMGPAGSGLTFFYRMADELWHTVVPNTEFVIVHETTRGPFIRNESELAPWSPDYGDAEGINAFLRRLSQRERR
ncbi:MAG: WbuC family cupin fold metalloprotein [Candidatus Omnitrophota bacterium]